MHHQYRDDRMVWIQYVSVVMKRWWLVAALLLVCTLAGLAVVWNLPRVYEATTILRVGQTLEMANPSLQDLSVSRELAETYMYMVSRRPILQAVADGLTLPSVPRDRDISARVVPGTQFLEISVRDAEPERARAIANAIAEQLILQTPKEVAKERARHSFVQGQLQSLETEIRAIEEEILQAQQEPEASDDAQTAGQREERVADLQQKLESHRSTYASLSQIVQNRTNFISVFEPAITPAKPARPWVKIVVPLSALAGLCLGVGIAHLIEHLDHTVRTSDDLSSVTGLPTLGTIGRLKGNEDSAALVALRQPRSPVAEAYRQLRTTLLVLSPDRPVQTLVVTSPGLAEGKTTTAANLGVVMAQAGKSVVLVDADLRQPAMHEVFNLSNRIGLTYALIQDRRGLEGWLQETEVENLWVLTSGAPPLNPSELLGSQEMQMLIERLKTEADLVIFDTPPLLVVTDAAVLATQADGVLVVAEAAGTRRAAAAQAAAGLQQVGSNVLGTVLNKSPLPRLEDYYYPETPDASQQVANRSMASPAR